MKRPKIDHFFQLWYQRFKSHFKKRYVMQTGDEESARVFFNENKTRLSVARLVAYAVDQWGKEQPVVTVKSFFKRYHRSPPDLSHYGNPRTKKGARNSRRERGTDRHRVTPEERQATRITPCPLSQNIEITNRQGDQAQACPVPPDVSAAPRPEEIEQLLDEILMGPTVDLKTLAELSPLNIPATAAQQGSLFLKTLFPDDAVVWIGGKFDTVQAGDSNARKDDCRRHFKTVNEWRLLNVPFGNFTTACTFMPRSFSRSKKRVLSSPFFVVESRHLSRPDVLKVFRFISEYFTICAVVDVKGEDLRAWFASSPDSDNWQFLRMIAAGLKLSPKMFHPDQPTRMPGAKRGKGYQCVRWLQRPGGNVMLPFGPKAPPLQDANQVCAIINITNEPSNAAA